MLRIDFESPRTALEIREPLIKACSAVATDFGLYAVFDQRQQPAFEGRAHMRGRRRIGNGKHKNWYVNFQEDEPRISNPRVVGKLVLKSDMDPENGQYGGFYYGKYGEEQPTYRVLTVCTPSEVAAYRPLDPEPELLAAAYEAIEGSLDTGQGLLFDLADYVRV